jgi:dTDP-4-dehydrorhamnose reductase
MLSARRDRFGRMSRRLLVFGATSLVGSHLLEHAPEGFELYAIGRSNPATLGLSVAGFSGVPLEEKGTVQRAIRDLGPAAVVNFAGRTDVDGCEAERPSAPLENAEASGTGSALRVNGEFPGWVAEACARAGVHFIQISTDFVFDGRDGPYPESSPPSPFGPALSWYGYTKGIGEASVRHWGSDWAIVRLAYPYRTRFDRKLDLARSLLARRESGTLYPLYTDQRITPTWVPDVTRTLGRILSDRAHGVFHVASPSACSPFEFAQALFAEFRGPPVELHSTRLAEAALSVGRAPRPVSGGLQVSRIRELGIVPLDYRRGIREMRIEAYGSD